MHKAKLFLLLLSGLLLSGYGRGETVRDCDLIEQAKLEGAINPQLVLAVANVESSKNGKAMNGTHYGLMQLKLGTARMLGFRGKPKELLNWKVNLKYGSQYLNSHLRRYQSEYAAAAAYNAGAVFRCKRTHQDCKKGHYVNQKYVNRVMGAYRILTPECYG